MARRSPYELRIEDALGAMLVDARITVGGVGRLLQAIYDLHRTSELRGHVPWGNPRLRSLPRPSSRSRARK